MSKASLWKKRIQQNLTNNAGGGGGNDGWQPTGTYRVVGDLRFPPKNFSNLQDALAELRQNEACGVHMQLEAQVSRRGMFSPEYKWTEMMTTDCRGEVDKYLDNAFAAS